MIYHRFGRQTHFRANTQQMGNQVVVLFPCASLNFRRQESESESDRTCTCPHAHPHLTFSPFSVSPLDLYPCGSRITILARESSPPTLRSSQFWRFNREHRTQLSDCSSLVGLSVDLVDVRQCLPLRQNRRCEAIRHSSHVRRSQ